jgi:hypothetical protein
MKQRDLRGAREEPERRLHRAGVRAPIVAMKPGNAGGAKGCREMEDAMSQHNGQTPEAVSARTTRAGETRWSWVEPLVWTPRMLAALEAGVKGGKWYSLMDKVHPQDTLKAAFAEVAANQGAAGVDHVTIRQFASDLDANLKRLSEGLRTGSYRPQAIRRHYIAKPGRQEKRPLGIPTVRDRVVQTALRMALEPIFERDFAAELWLPSRTGMQGRAATGG